jgi:lipopolysaccharide transport system ATP-binding protein
MAELALRISNVSKRYRIGRLEARHHSLREALTAGTRRLARRLMGRAGNGSDGHSEFWALRDVSIDVEHGEILGIIGQNGAGKSTLLKILSRITEPTRGRVEAWGRVGSLLEVGTGFHPELTGRENVYLNGSILGMRRSEVDRKFDEIAAFSGVEAFLDTPVKRYSSGMYVRLAFAVAAHLEPEILVVDEVLSVGDAEFQRRCLQKMEGVARGGRTVLLVSHNMATVQAFCTRAVLLRQGVLAASGSPADTVQAYLRGLETVASQDLLTRTDRSGPGRVRLTSLVVETEGAPPGVLASGQPARFVFDVDTPRRGMTCSFTIYDQLGRAVTYFDSAELGEGDMIDSSSPARFCCEVEELLLIPGRYRINAGIASDGELQDHIEAAAFFDVEAGLLRGRPVARAAGFGNALMPHRWSVPA